MDAYRVQPGTHLDSQWLWCYSGEPSGSDRGCKPSSERLHPNSLIDMKLNRHSIVGKKHENIPKVILQWRLEDWFTPLPYDVNWWNMSQYLSTVDKETKRSAFSSHSHESYWIFSAHFALLHQSSHPPAALIRFSAQAGAYSRKPAHWHDAWLTLVQVRESMAQYFE